MSITLKNGVVLPDFADGMIPPDSYVIIGYPSSFQSGKPTLITDFYYAMISSGPFLYLPAELSPLGAGVVLSLGEVLGGAAFYGVEWLSGTIDTTFFDGCLLWADHDIKTVTAFNEETFELTVGDEIYFPNSETPAEPEYGKIRRAIIRDASNAVRRKTGRTDKFPPEQLEYEIDSIVTADGLPVAEETTFGHIYENNDVTITKYGGVELPLIPDEISSKQYIVFQNKSTGEYWITTNPSTGFVRNQNNGIKPYTIYDWRDYKLNNGVWLDNGQRAMVIWLTDNTVVFTNHNIGEENNISNVLYPAQTPVEEVVVGKTSNPVSRDEYYQISSEIMNMIAYHVQQLSDSEELMTPIQMVSILESL